MGKPISLGGGRRFPQWGARVPPVGVNDFPDGNSRRAGVIDITPARRLSHLSTPIDTVDTYHKTILLSILVNIKLI